MSDVWHAISADGAQAVRISLPLVLAAVGGSFSERAGVMNIALEGMLLTGAFAAVWGTWATGTPAAGVLAAILAGLLVAALHAVVSVTLRGNQIVSAIAINLLAAGATRFALQVIWGSAANSARVADFAVLDLRDPILTTLLGTPLVTLGIAVVLASVIIQARTPFGLHLRAAGDHPRAAHASGLDVVKLRYAAVLISGALAALGGAVLALSQGLFSDGMSGGRGFIALAALIVGRWTPLGAAVAALFFGVTETVEIHLQRGAAQGLIQLFPYIATMIVLAGWVRRAEAPQGLGKPWTPES